MAGTTEQNTKVALRRRMVVRYASPVVFSSDFKASIFRIEDGRLGFVMALDERGNHLKRCRLNIRELREHIQRREAAIVTFYGQKLSG